VPSNTSGTHQIVAQNEKKTKTHDFCFHLCRKCQLPKANIVVVSLFSRICFVYGLVFIDLKILIGAMGFFFFFFSSN
jgi:hypothetical protein